MSDLLDINKIAATLIARFSSAFVDKISHFSRVQMNSIGGFLGIGLTSLVAEQLRQIRHIRTFLSPEDPTEFSEVYVNLYLAGHGGELIRDDDLIPKLAKSERTTIVGTAGSGKSMLLRYIVQVVSASSECVPVLLELRNYYMLRDSNTNHKIEFFDFIYDVTHARESVSRDLFIELLRTGGFMFLLDGFDEVEPSRRRELETEVEAFFQRFPYNSYLVTSRPGDSVPRWSEFRILRVQPLSLLSAKLLVKKCKFDEKLKSSFIEEMEQLYVSHGSFLSNPLLVTIMLLLFHDVVKIPTKLSLFFSMAFDVLYFRHDLLKPGRYVRKRYTRIAIDEFRRVLSVFCALTYAHNAYSFILPELMNFLAEAIKYCDSDVDAEEFRKDLVESVPLLQADGIYYTFIHRSFQEFFSAYFLANDAHVDVYAYIDGIVERQGTDSVVTRLLEINQGIFEKKWLIPFLIEWIRIADEALAAGRIHFLFRECFGRLCFVIDDEHKLRVWWAGLNPLNASPKIALIRHLYADRWRTFNPRSDDRPVIEMIEAKKIAVSTDKVIAAARDILTALLTAPKITERSIAREFPYDVRDDKWLSEVALADLIGEWVQTSKKILQELEQHAHRKQIFQIRAKEDG